MDELDRQHQRLIQLVSCLHDAMKVRAPKIAQDRIVSDLVTYTRFHFECEERLMSECGFPLLEEHLQEHESLKNTIVRLEEDMRAGRIVISPPLLEFLKSWITSHILESDMKYAPYMSGSVAA